MNNKKVLIIVGAAKSGSTLLTKAIGGHSRCFAGGELNRFDQEVTNSETQCGCSKYLKDCNFWNDIFDSLNLKKTNGGVRNLEKFKIGIFNELTSKQNIVELIKVILFKRPYTGKIASDEIHNTFKLYDTLFDKTNAEIIIDSSKNLFRALVLASFDASVKFYFIFLTRDGRGVLNSGLKQTYTILKEDGSKDIFTNKRSKDYRKIIKKWCYINLRNFIILKIFYSKKIVQIKYEDFTANPKRELTKIFQKVGLDFEENALDLVGNENHILGGNASRINAKKVQKQDDAWKTNLDKHILKVFYKKAGWVNRLLGYKK